MNHAFNRRAFLQGLALSSLAVSSGLSANPIKRQAGFSRSAQGILRGSRFHLTIGETGVNVSGKARKAVTVNGSMPAPTLYMKEGEQVTIHVHNTLHEDTSIHWHGFLLPYQMDGVPGISFQGIKPGQTFTYQFPLLQSGTYWYHSHSGFQEQLGMYGAIVIEPKQPEPFKADREHVIVLSDWTDKDPMSLLRQLKTESDFDNYHQPTLTRLIADMRKQGVKDAINMRKMWNQMRMLPTDFTDLSAVTTFHYLMNGIPAAGNWTGLFNAGETVRLRIINASAHSIFDFRIPGLPMTVIGSDGELVEPVTVDEIRIGAAETYDVLIKPQADAYTVFAQDIGRSGFVSGTLAVQEGLQAPVPVVDQPQWLSMTDMMGDINGKTRATHAHSEFGWSTDMQVDRPRINLDDPGINLRNNGRKVLTYANLHGIGHALHQQREPQREIELHLTGNMERYIWGFDGQTYAEAKPVHLGIGERVRISLVNDTMMTHPMHLHGMWSDLRQPNGDFQVRKHTLIVQPAQKISFDVTGEAGHWAWHCHLLYHMEAGMFRSVVVD